MWNNEYPSIKNSRVEFYYYKYRKTSVELIKPQKGKDIHSDKINSLDDIYLYILTTPNISSILDSCGCQHQQKGSQRLTKWSLATGLILFNSDKVLGTQSIVITSQQYVLLLFILTIKTAKEDMNWEICPQRKEGKKEEK